MASLGWPMMWRAVFGERQLPAALGEDRRRRRRGADGRCRRGCRRGRRGARPCGVMPAPGGAGRSRRRCSRWWRRCRRAGRSGRARCRRPGSPPCGAAISARKSVGSNGSMSLVRSAARRCSTRRLGPTPQAHREADQRLELRRAGDADVDRQGDAGGAAARSAQAIDRARRRSRTGWRSPSRASVSRWKPALRASAAIAMASPPAGSMSPLPSGWPATCRRVKPRASKTAGLAAAASPRRRRRAGGRCRRRSPAPRGRPTSA